MILSHGIWAFALLCAIVDASSDSAFSENEENCADRCNYEIEGSICISDVCECPTGTVLYSTKTKCGLAAPEYGAACEDSVQCSELLSSGGVCLDDKCQCGPGYHYLRGLCWKSVALKGECRSDMECFSNYEYIGLECKDGKCECRDGYYDRLGVSCRRIATPGESCNLNQDCQCSDGSRGKCNNKICQCDDRRSFVHDYLYQQYDHRDRHDQYDQYDHHDHHDYRVQDTNCPLGYFLNGDQCVLELGMNCTDITDCTPTLKAAECVDGICGCKPNLYIVDPSNRKCIKSASGQVDVISTSSCSEDYGCWFVFGSRSFCNNKLCACDSSAHWEVEDQICWQNKALGEPCYSDKDCHVSSGPAECTGTDPTRSCSCLEGYHSAASGTECRKDGLHFGEVCVEDSDCVYDNSACETDTKTCRCRTHYYLDTNGRCVAGLGSTCADDGACSVGNSSCVDQSCQCLQDFVPSVEDQFCLPVARFGDSCNETVQCAAGLGNLTECRDGQCQCETKAHYRNGRCFETRLLGESCTRKSECVTTEDAASFLCQKGLCTCQYDYVQGEDNRCLRDESGSSVRVQAGLQAVLTSLTLFLLLKIY